MNTNIDNTALKLKLVDLEKKYKAAIKLVGEYEGVIEGLFVSADKNERLIEDLERQVEFLKNAK